MSEDNKRAIYDDLTQGVTYEELVAQLERAEAKKPCAACGQNEWLIIMDNDAKAPALMQLENARDIAKAYWHFASACTKCGNMRFFHANFIAVQVKRHRKSDEQP